jgi:formamidopyrimidine-DNA glycosylase
MPELPEVESLRRSLEPVMLGQKIIKVEVFKPKLVSSHGTKRTENIEKVAEFIKELTGETIVKIDRVAKNIIITTKSGKIILVHLKMTGQLVYVENQKKDGKEKSGKIVSGGHPIENKDISYPSKHSHIIFKLGRGTLYYNDTRMFGYLLYYKNEKELFEQEHFKTGGLDPFHKDFDQSHFIFKFSSLPGTVKKNFLDQKVVNGLGNIYADEVCFASHVNPMRQNKSLTYEELVALYNNIQEIIFNAISDGGSSVANYLMADGSKGNYAKKHKVYNRGGKPCLICGTILTSIKHAGRTTVFCEKCQEQG